MEITSQLLRPLIDRLKVECQDLLRQINGDPSEEALQLRSFIQRKIRQIEMLGVSVTYANSLPEQPDLPVLRNTFRQLKLEMRFAQRRWRRLQLNQTRARKNQEKRGLTPSVAA